MQFRGYSEIEDMIHQNAYRGRRKHEYAPLRLAAMNKGAGSVKNKKGEEKPPINYTFSPTKKICLRENWVSK